LENADIRRSPVSQKYTGWPLIFLVGFSGSGKSTVGPLLARNLDMKFTDLDSEIAITTGMSIPAIFERRGESFFRKQETLAIAEITSGPTPEMVVALGGGALQSRANRGLVQECGLSIYLSCAIDEIYRRMKNQADRPLLNVVPKKGETVRQATMLQIRRLIARRKPHYAEADITVSTTNHTAAETVAILVEKLERFRG
jgi:shikimate kinase